MNIFAAKNWSRYSRQFADDKESLYKYKRVILLSQFALIGSVVGVVHAMEDLIDGVFLMPMMDMIMAVGIFCCYVTNERGKHKLARIMMVGFLNIFFFIYSSLANKDIGIYLYYFPWVALAALIFERDENFHRWFFVGLSVLCIVMLFATDFNAFGPREFAVEAIERSFIINFISSTTVLVFFIVFMANMNEQSEKKLYQLAIEVKTKNDGLEKANRELDRFFYSTSHDLKVPLMDMKGILNMAMAEPQEGKVMAYFAMLRDRADKLDGFLKDVIDYARNAQTGVKSEPVNFHLLIEDVINNFRFVSGADKITFERNVNVDHYVEVDRIRLFIVLNNILSNAIKYHRQEIRYPFVEIFVVVKNEMLSISVTDNGQGIEADMLPKIFDMFFRGTNQSKGSGLGLYIVKETLERMNGSISVHSTLQEGTTFKMTVPVKLNSRLPDPALSKVLLQ